MPRILSAAGGLVGAVALAAVVTAPAAYAAPANLNGSAFGVKVDVEVADKPLVNVAPLPSVDSKLGGDKSVIELEAREITEESNGVVHARLINAASNAKDGLLTSRASVADLALALQSKTKGVVSLTAELVTAKCTYGPDGITAESALSNVDIKTLAGLKKQLVSASAKSGVAVEPNTEINVLGLGKVVLNEQIKSDKGMVVNAVHVYLTPKLKLLYGDIIVSQATCYKGAQNDPTASPSEPGDDPDPSASATSPGEPTEPTPTDSAGGGGGLPNTGFKLATFAGLGLALVAAGAGALWFTRRRREATEES